MSTVPVLIPVKPLNLAKSSFSSVLSPTERKGLTLAMLTDVLRAVCGCELAEPYVVSADLAVLKHARSMGAKGLREPGLELNDALRWGIEQLKPSSVLIIPADLPLLRSPDVEHIIQLSTTRSVVIAPSKTSGTNALLLRPADVIPLCFGGESFPVHCEKALRAGVDLKVYRSPHVEFDLDEPSDIARVLAEGMGTATYEFLTSLKPRIFDKQVETKNHEKNSTS